MFNKQIKKFSKMGSIYSILRARASGTLSYIYLIYPTL